MRTLTETMKRADRAISWLVELFGGGRGGIAADKDAAARSSVRLAGEGRLPPAVCSVMTFGTPFHSDKSPRLASDDSARCVCSADYAPPITPRRVLNLSTRWPASDEQRELLRTLVRSRSRSSSRLREQIDSRGQSWTVVSLLIALRDYSIEPSRGNEFSRKSERKQSELARTNSLVNLTQIYLA